MLGADTVGFNETTPVMAWKGPGHGPGKRPTKSFNETTPVMAWKECDPPSLVQHGADCKLARGVGREGRMVLADSRPGAASSLNVKDRERLPAFRGARDRTRANASGPVK